MHDAPLLSITAVILTRNCNIQKSKIIQRSTLEALAEWGSAHVTMCVDENGNENLFLMEAYSPTSIFPNSQEQQDWWAHKDKTCMRTLFLKTRFYRNVAHVFDNDLSHYNMWLAHSLSGNTCVESYVYPSEEIVVAPCDENYVSSARAQVRNA